jgi:hypothetical protein
MLQDCGVRMPVGLQVPEGAQAAGLAAGQGGAWAVTATEPRQRRRGLACPASFPCRWPWLGNNGPICARWLYLKVQRTCSPVGKKPRVSTNPTSNGAPSKEWEGAITRLVQRGSAAVRRQADIPHCKLESQDRQDRPAARRSLPLPLRLRLPRLRLPGLLLLPGLPARQGR